MSKKDYEKIARVLAGEQSLAQGLGHPVSEALNNITRSIADVFAQDNPRFDRAKFYDAAELGKW